MKITFMVFSEEWRRKEVLLEQLRVTFPPLLAEEGVTTLDEGVEEALESLHFTVYH